MKHSLLSLILLNFFLFNSCKKYEPAPDAFFIKPAYVSVAPTSTLQGSASHKIADLYLYVNGKFQGAYKTGNSMPVVTGGQNASINVFAGIKNNGISETSITWLFYDKISFDTLVESGKTINRPFTFKYNPNVKFAWVEDFDGLGISLIRSASTNSATSLNLNTSHNFEGKSAMFECGPFDLAEFESSIDYTVPLGNPNVYLELNYKCNAEFEVGITDGLNRKQALMINPKEDWNKIYITLADAVNREPVSNKYKVYFKLRKTNDYPDPRVWLDNIKLIYL